MQSEACYAHHCGAAARKRSPHHCSGYILPNASWRTIECYTLGSHGSECDPSSDVDHNFRCCCFPKLVPLLFNRNSSGILRPDCFRNIRSSPDYTRIPAEWATRARYGLCLPVMASTALFSTPAYGEQGLVNKTMTPKKRAKFFGLNRGQKARTYTEVRKTSVLLIFPCCCD